MSETARWSLEFILVLNIILFCDVWKCYELWLWQFWCQIWPQSPISCYFLKGKKKRIEIQFTDPNRWISGLQANLLKKKFSLMIFTVKTLTCILIITCKHKCEYFMTFYTFILWNSKLPLLTSLGGILPYLYNWHLCMYWLHDLGFPWKCSFHWLPAASMYPATLTVNELSFSFEIYHYFCVWSSWILLIFFLFLGIVKKIWNLESYATNFHCSLDSEVWLLCGPWNLFDRNSYFIVLWWLKLCKLLVPI